MVVEVYVEVCCEFGWLFELFVMLFLDEGLFIVGWVMLCEILLVG